LSFGEKKQKWGLAYLRNGESMKGEEIRYTLVPPYNSGTLPHQFRGVYGGRKGSRIPLSRENSLSRKSFKLLRPAEKKRTSGRGSHE